FPGGQRRAIGPSPTISTVPGRKIAMSQLRWWKRWGRFWDNLVLAGDAVRDRLAAAFPKALPRRDRHALRLMLESLERRELFSASTGVTAYRVPPPNSPSDIKGLTAGPDGNLWFTEPMNNALVAMSPLG